LFRSGCRGVGYGWGGVVAGLAKELGDFNKAVSRFGVRREVGRLGSCYVALCQSKSAGEVGWKWLVALGVGIFSKVVTGVWGLWEIRQSSTVQ